MIRTFFAKRGYTPSYQAIKLNGTFPRIGGDPAFRLEKTLI